MVKKFELSGNWKCVFSHLQAILELTFGRVYFYKRLENNWFIDNLIPKSINTNNFKRFNLTYVNVMDVEYT